jgi:hypothetical protein
MTETKGFLPTNKKMPPHIKEKKMQKNTIHPAAPNFQLKKKEKRKKEKEGRKLRPMVVRSRPDPRQCRADSRLAGHRDPRLGLTGVFLWLFFGFSFRWV